MKHSHIFVFIVIRTNSKKENGEAKCARTDANIEEIKKKVKIIHSMYTVSRKKVNIMYIVSRKIDIS